MSMPFYVAPEQVMKDRADYARKGIARGRSLAALVYDDGILMCAENPSSTLRKISEIYDRIAFAGVGKYNEFDQLRIAGIRAADLKGYSYSREDVDARSLANQYAQILGPIFTHEMKPMEVEILVAEVGEEPGQDQMFHILYDGTVMDEHNYTVLGGEAEAIAARLREAWREGLDLAAALTAAVKALSGPDRSIAPGELEAAVLARSNGRRAFRRIDRVELADVLPDSQAGATSAPGGNPGTEPTPGGDDPNG
jgi:proteasome alpha subunit